MTDLEDTNGTPLFIDGQARYTTEVLRVVDPARPSKIVGRAASATPADVTDAVAAAKTAFVGWSSLSSVDRAQWMSAAISGIAENRDADAAILSQENGKVVKEAWIDSLVFEIRWNLALALADQIDTSVTLAPIPGAIPVSTEVMYQPLGVTTIIIPFNWPVAILGAALPHALLAGNTVIVKVPVTAPLATARIVQRIAEKLPAGVLNVISGEDENMQGLIQNTDVAKVCFTGSVQAGKRIMALASSSLTRVTLELGGNDAAILLSDAVLDDAHLDRLYAAIFDTTGQICMNVKRVYVHRSRLDELVSGLESRLSRVRLGYGLEDTTTMGPLHQRGQKEFVQALVQEAKDSGADVREFGELPEGDLSEGYFVRPAIVIAPNPTLRVVVQEQFGPVIPILPFGEEGEAVEAANATWAGLGGSVWTASSAAAQRIGRQLECGYVWVNDHGATRLDLRAPFGGMKQSGIGREQGIEGVRSFQDTRAIATLDPVSLEAMSH